jgi:hypothetical protein
MSSKKKTEKQARSNQDSAWKDILDVYFREFMEFFYPDIAKKIDWTSGYETLDKELQSITTDAMVGKRFVDKLFKVKTVEGQEEVILVHVEIQGEKEDEFPLRLFRYYYRLFDKRDQSILTLAILTDDNNRWHPRSYQKQVLGFPILSFNFQTNKLLDYKKNQEDLENNTNPFTTIVLAHLAFIETKNNPKTRFWMKFKLTRRLYEKGYSKDYVLNLFKVIDWVLVLPRDLALEYKNKVHELEEEKRMRYITSIEQLGREEGLQQGIQQGEYALLHRLLQRKFRHVPQHYLDRMSRADADTLLKWGESVLDANDLSDIFNEDE